MKKSVPPKKCPPSNTISYFIVSMDEFRYIKIILEIKCIILYYAELTSWKTDGKQWNNVSYFVVQKYTGNLLKN